MMAIASTWLALALLLSLFSWFANRRLICASLPFAAIIAAFALYVPLGRPIPLSPGPGKYTVLGAKIVVDVGIWVLLDDGASEPRYFRLPYSNAAAGQLQGAEDAGQGQPSSVKMQVGQDGGVAYDGPPPTASDTAPKHPEQPAVTTP